MNYVMTYLLGLVVPNCSWAFTPPNQKWNFTSSSSRLTWAIVVDPGKANFAVLATDVQFAFDQWQVVETSLLLFEKF